MVVLGITLNILNLNNLYTAAIAQSVRPIAPSVGVMVSGGSNLAGGIKNLHILKRLGLGIWIC